jgi:phage gp36-like protein
MGNYATTAELQTRFENAAEIEILTDVIVGGGVDEDVLTDVVEAAEGDINSRIGRRYATPVDTSIDTEIAALLKRKTLDLAEYYLYRRGDEASEMKALQAQRVFDWADGVARGEYVLPGAATPASTASDEPRAAWSDTSRTQSDDSGRVCTRDAFSQL